MAENLVSSTHARSYFSADLKNIVQKLLLAHSHAYILKVLKTFYRCLCSKKKYGEAIETQKLQ